MWTGAAIYPLIAGQGVGGGALSHPLTPTGRALSAAGRVRAGGRADFHGTDATAVYGSRCVLVSDCRVTVWVYLSHAICSDGQKTEGCFEAEVTED